MSRPTLPSTSGRRAPRLGRGLGVFVLLLALATLGAFAAAWATLGDVPETVIHLTVNGEQIHLRPDGPLPSAHAVVLAALGAVLGLASLLAVILLVPLTLVLVLAAVAAALFAGVGLPLMLLVALGALLLSPVLLLGWLLWRALRPPRSIGA